MSEVVTAIRQGASEVKLKGASFRVLWFNEPGEIEDDEGRALFQPKRIHQLLLLREGGSPLSFYGKDRETCLEHLDGYISREVSHV